MKYLESGLLRKQYSINHGIFEWIELPSFYEMSYTIKLNKKLMSTNSELHIQNAERIKKYLGDSTRFHQLNDKFLNYKFGPSQLHKLLTTPRAGLKISKTAMTYLKEVFVKETYGLKMIHKIKSKYLEHGILAEEESIRLISRFFMVGLEKNEKIYENEYFRSIPDIVDNNYVVEVKSSFSPLTFPIFEHKAKPEHLIQINTYLGILGKEKGYVAYVLTSPDESIIAGEIRKASYGITDEATLKDIEEKIRHDYDYSFLDEAERITIFEVDYDKEHYEKAVNAVIDARNYLLVLLSNRIQQISDGI